MLRMEKCASAWMSHFLRCWTGRRLSRSCGAARLQKKGKGKGKASMQGNSNADLPVLNVPGTVSLRWMSSGGPQQLPGMRLFDSGCVSLRPRNA